ncbi:MAG: hypothetical protein QOJ12_1809 [Thermoleophilales bacterium]|nr:hypothetical protein [Thermoleophilales bacterium]
MTVADELARLVAGTREARARSAQRIDAMLEAVDFGELQGVLLSQRLLPLVGSRIVAIGGDRVPGDFARAVEAAAAAERRRGLFSSHVTRSLVAALESAGVPAVPFKGTVTAERVHGDLGLRPSSDIDLLAERSQLRTALGVLLDLGYELPHGRSSDAIPPLHYGLVDGGGQRPDVDLHWRVHWYEEDYGAAMIERSLTDPDLGRVLAPLDDLTMLLLCYARDGFVGLRYPADIAAWWDRFGDELAPGELDRLVARHPGLERALVAAVRVTDSVVDVPLTPLLAAARRPDWRTRTAIRLANWAERGASDQVVANERLVDWLLSPRGGSAAFARRFVLPGRSSVVRYDHLPAESRPPEAIWRLTHPAKLLSRCLSAMWRVRGQRAWARVDPS